VRTENRVRQTKEMEGAQNAPAPTSLPPSPSNSTKMHFRERAMVLSEVKEGPLDDTTLGVAKWQAR
jgi:hypothetical protein